MHGHTDPKQADLQRPGQHTILRESQAGSGVASGGKLNCIPSLRVVQCAIAGSFTQ